MYGVFSAGSEEERMSREFQLLLRYIDAGGGMDTRKSGNVVGQHLERARGRRHKRSDRQSSAENVHVVEELHLEQLEGELLGYDCLRDRSCPYLYGQDLRRRRSRSSLESLFSQPVLASYIEICQAKFLFGMSLTYASSISTCQHSANIINTCW
jgi:hypothetical protein